MLLIIAMIFILLRSLSAVMLTVLIIFLADILAFGFKAYFDGVVSPMTAFAPSVILIFAVADCIYFLSSYLTFIPQGYSKQDAIKKSLRLNYKAINLTSLMTIIGFLCFNFSSSPAIRGMGNVVVLGFFSLGL